MAKRNTPKRQDSPRVNSFKLFFRRHSSGLSIATMSQLTQISEDRLRQFEAVDLQTANGDQASAAFPVITETELSKIAKVLNVSPNFIKAGKTDDFATDQIAYMKTYLNVSPAPQGSIALPADWKAKAVVFDFDGTLTQTGSGTTRTTWETIWEKAGYDVNDCGLLANRYFSGAITHSQWCQLTLEKFKDRELTFEAVVSAAKDIKLIKGFEDCIEELAAMDIPLFIVSGAIWDVLGTVLGKFVKRFRRIESNVFGYDHEAKLATITGTKYDFEGKGVFVSEIARDLGIATSDVLFVGNSINDVHVKKSGARTLLVNPHFTDPSDGRAWDHYVPRLDSLVNILPFVDVNWKKNRELKVQQHFERILDAVQNVHALKMSELVVMGNYTRHSERDRSFLVGLADKIRRPLIEKSETRENFLLFAPPGSGKTFFVNELARVFKETHDLEFIEIDLSRDDKATCESKLEILKTTTKPCLCMIDEIDGRKGEDWPYDLFYKKLDLNEIPTGRFVFVLIGSSGGDVKSLGANIRAREKGKDLVDRILKSEQHCAAIPPMGLEDSVVVFATKVLEAAAKHNPPKEIHELGRAAVFFALLTCGTPRQFKMLADQAVRRVPHGHTQLLFDHLFEATDKASKDAFEEAYRRYMEIFGNVTFKISL